MIRPRGIPPIVTATLVLPYSTTQYQTVAPPGLSRRRRHRIARTQVRSARSAAHSQAFLAHQISTGYRTASGALSPSPPPATPGAGLPPWLWILIGYIGFRAVYMLSPWYPH